jgi:hypothetical protein
MKHLPKTPYAGKLCRLSFDGGLNLILQRLSSAYKQDVHASLVTGCKWQTFSIETKSPLTSTSVETNAEGSFFYPFLARVSGDRIILVAREAALIDQIFEISSVSGHVDSPRILIDKAVRDLVFPAGGTSVSAVGRKYTIGSIYAAVEGYARALRSISLFGDDLAEAELFRYALKQMSVHRAGIRDPATDKELMSVSSNGGVDFHYKGVSHLNAIDALTSFMRVNGYIEWRNGRLWQPDMDHLASNQTGKSQIL